mmetsp:Transcript_14534/g.21437  ORF Transcript_14534/g.21437 Transcript_14534/m.21437 type:complete len:380 (+) Transcript_14534:61-1200(+)
MSRAASPGKILLRVKRLKNEDPVSLLQFSGKKRARKADVQDISEQLSSTNLKDISTSALIWKRIDNGLKELEPEDKSGSCLRSTKSKRSHKFIDATLGPTDKKRRRLTLQQSPTFASHRKEPKRVILDPLSRLVDENLKKAQVGSATLQNYLDFLEQDTRVSQEVHRYIGRSLDDGSNVLHIAALWNCVEQARHILLRFGSLVNIDEVDSSGHRPYQIAKLSGNDQVAEVIEAFGADTYDYEYDIFYLSNQKEDAHTEEATMVELEGGIGYLTNEGELIFEACSDNNTDDSSAEGDDDIDSNAEEHEDNDYPEEEEDESQSDDDSNEEWRVSFRNETATKKNGLDYNGEEDVYYDDEIDFYSHEEEVRHDYAYDPHYDD